MRRALLFSLLAFVLAPLAADAREVRRKKRKVRRKPPRTQPKAPPPRASSAHQSAFVYGLDVFMVEGKAMGGIRLGGYSGALGFDLAGDLIWLTERDQSGVVDDFVGALVGGYVYGRPIRSRAAELRVGTGLDVYPLFGVNADEVLYSWPIFIEGRFWTAGDWGVGAQLRFSLLHSEGLEPGVSRDGQVGFPVMLVLNLGGRS